MNILATDRSMRYELNTQPPAAFLFCQVKTEHSKLHMFRSVRLVDHNNQVNSNAVFLSYPTIVFKNDSLQNQHTRPHTHTEGATKKQPKCEQLLFECWDMAKPYT